MSADALSLFLITKVASDCILDYRCDFFENSMLLASISIPCLILSFIFLFVDYVMLQEFAEDFAARSQSIVKRLNYVKVSSIKNLFLFFALIFGSISLQVSIFSRFILNYCVDEWFILLYCTMVYGILTFKRCTCQCFRLLFKISIYLLQRLQVFKHPQP